MTTRRHVSDPTTVAAILAGYRGTDSTIEDREEVVRRLNAEGRSDPDIAAATGWSRRTVLRIRNRLEIPAAVTFAGTPVEMQLSARAKVMPPRELQLVGHPGMQKTVAGRTDRSDGSNVFIDAFFSDPFNRLVNETIPPCGDRWDLFSPPEKSDHFDYSSQEHKTDERRRKREARAICARCPIQAECLDYAMRPGPLGGTLGTSGEVGIWAGTTEKGREELHRQRKRTAKQLSAKSMSSSSN